MLRYELNMNVVVMTKRKGCHCIFNQFMHNLGEPHMNAVMRILRYLKSTPGKVILLSKNTDFHNINVYTDAD